MKLSAGFEPAPALAPVPAPTPAPFQAFNAKSFFANRKLKIQNFSFTISKRCFDIFMENSKTLFWIFKSKSLQLL